METEFILHFISEIAYLLIVFGVFFFIAIAKGRQAIINLIFSLYLALLISIHFPYYPQLLGTMGPEQQSIGQLALFIAFTIAAVILCFRIMPDEFREEKLESIPQKFILAAAGTVLVMIFSFHVLPVTEFMTPGTPLQTIFAPEGYFFWWLLLPLVILFVV